MKITILLLLSVLMFTSCGDEEKDLSVAFNLEYDDQPLVMFQEYEFGEEGGFPVEFSRISFYISEVEMTVDGQKELFREVDYIDLTESHSTLEKAEEGFIYEIGTTKGDVTDISFNFGLTAAQNATVPADYPSTNALSRTSEYWSGWESYVMMKFEGNIDLDRDGVKEKGIALHLGTDSVMRPTSGTYSDDLAITLDIQKVFNCGEVFDIENTTQIHNLSQVEKSEQLADNIACGLEYVN